MGYITTQQPKLNMRFYCILVLFGSYVAYLWDLKGLSYITVHRYIFVVDVAVFFGNAREYFLNLDLGLIIPLTMPINTAVPIIKSN